MTPTTPTDLTLHSHQKAFLRHCRRNPKPLPILLRDRRIDPSTLERWRTDPTFEHAFQRSVRHLTRDTTTELRLALSVAMSLISSEITTLHKALLDKTLTKESQLTLPHDALKLCFDFIKLGDTLLFPKRSNKPRKPFKAPDVPPHLLKELQELQRKTLRTHFTTALAEIGLPLPPDPRDLPAPTTNAHGACSVGSSPTGVVSSADHVSPTPDAKPTPSGVALPSEISNLKSSSSPTPAQGGHEGDHTPSTGDSTGGPQG